MKLLHFIRQHRPECICFAVFIVLAITGYCTHELWYDEAQAWQIAKTASVKDILFTIPHYEGHPPFWHLLLAIPAKLGVPWQWGIGGVGLLFMLANGFLIFFKAPFPRWVRCLLPFSYFLFYQYGIIVRPYSALTLIMLLLAVYFPQKDKRPALYIVLLAALCACHVFGIAIAGGITIAWLWEMRAQRPWKQYLPSLIKEKRFHGMLLLLGWVILLFILLRQTDGVLDAYLHYTKSIGQQLLYIFLALPADTVLTNLGDELFIIQNVFAWPALFSTCVVGAALWALLLVFFPRKYLLYLLFPYIFLAAIFLHYSCRHHIGMILVLFIWYAWITLAKFPLYTRPDILKKLGYAVLLLALLIPIGWSLYSCYLDAKLVIFPGKNAVAFLEKYNLTDKTIFSSWTIKKNDYIAFGDPHSLPVAVMFNMYTPHNWIANLNNGSDQAYVINNLSTPQETTEILAYWRSRGLPDVLIGPAALPMLYDDPSIIRQYYTAYIDHTYQWWKFNRPTEDEFIIYLHQNVWNELKAKLLAETHP